MSTLVFCGGLSGLALLAALRRHHAANEFTAAVFDPATVRVARTQSWLDGTEILDGTTGRHRNFSRAVALFWPGPDTDFTGLPVVEVQAAGGGTERAADPLPWALAAGLPSFDLRLRLGVIGECGHDVAVAPGAGLPEVADAAAGVLLPCLDKPCKTASATSRIAARGRLPLHTRIDWNAPIGRIIGLVQACAWPVPGAWTTWRGVRLHISSASVGEDPGGPCPPGTVLDASPSGLLVAHAAGTVRLSGLRDVIGSIGPGTIEPGDVLGVGAEDVSRLERRVRDLECVVMRLAEGVDFL
ncbi:hypothetical protein [Mangrovihabitans endophyticus]|uniref:Methionyl-tRNA formyltransferase n=1 Tax=Mangrovihabitans endophyticus TaxID=1751298 RepID=A0A8J3BT96_9ACTN|nr:hypothetical protein [Mangrovihabitans endophyticus]GGK72591.1 hypothetical protein GCM10012284_02970 [Mangrovihabitans endophyticus]